MSLLERFKNPGPKRILSLDGGGIRGSLALGYLTVLEKTLQDRHKNPGLRLSDYFDLIGGTSTGSIIAAGLALGMSVEEIRALYFKLGDKVFGKRLKLTNVFKIRKALKSSFSEKPLEEQLEAVFGDITLGSDQLKTGLCIVAKRADTQSVWPLLNHPEGKFYDSEVGKNKDIFLRDAIRASAAAPTYFIPTVIEVGGGTDPNEKHKGAFVDGGVSMANNPALQLFMVATLKGFPFQWETGENKLLLFSIGTGNSNQKDKPENIVDRWLLDWAKEVPNMLMMDASRQNELMLQWMSKSKTPRYFDMEIGDLNDDLLTPEPLLSYLRYNVLLESDYLEKLGFNLSGKEAKNLQEMSEAKNIPHLFQIGAKAGSLEIKEEHIPNAFDLSFDKLVAS